MSGQELTEALVDRVKQAHEAGTPLAIAGSGSKAFYGHPLVGDTLSTREHAGIVNHEPTELVLTARAGTPLEEVETALAEEGQQFPFEPPHFGEGGTLGGAIAAGLAGPRRPYGGSVRDMVLGLRLINGRGELMRFGGEVMKNVAGYDVARLNVGALGTLGVITEVSLKVLPAPASTATLTLDLPMSDCHARTEGWLREGRPVSAVAHDGQQLFLRLSGTVSAVADAVRDIGGEAMDTGTAQRFWTSLRDQTHAFFADPQRPLWRVSLPPAADLSAFEGTKLAEWAGQQLWLRDTTDAATLRQTAESLGGSATLFRGVLPEVSVFHPLDRVKRRLHQSLKAAFDPRGILNPNRLYPELEEA